MRFFRFSLVVMSIALAFTFGAFSIPKENLVLHYDFAGGSINGDTATDLSGMGYDGTINGGASATGDGLEFDGSDGYVVTPALEVRMGGEIPFTAFCWFKTEEDGTGPLWMWGDNAVPSASSNAEAPVGWRSSSGIFSAGFYSGGHFYADGEDTYADGEWHFVAQVGEEAVGYLYIDGMQISSTTAGYIYSAQPYFLIGTRSKNSGSDLDDVEYFKGVIGQIGIYNVALSEAEIKEIMTETLAVSPSGKMASMWGEMKE
jgi:hypothetical protein